LDSKGFSNHGVHLQVARFSLNGFSSIRRQDDDWNIRAPTPDHPAKLNSIHGRHPEVGQNQAPGFRIRKASCAAVDWLNPTPSTGR
jgi:hypothetical protein